MATLSDMAEVCDNCSADLEIGQIGLCDKCQAPKAKKLQCEMRHECTNDVTHVGERGFIYCAEDSVFRRGFERCRKMQPWELALLVAGKSLPSYTRITKQAAIDRGMLALP
jgi:hypothetical protein